jgi:outer membrane protein TolC
MSIKKYYILLLAIPLFSGVQNLSLNQALKILKKENLELKIAKFNQDIKSYEAKIAKGYNYGKLDLTMQGIKSNDSGNVFGFKLQNREANFGDFGFAEFDMSGATNPLPVEPKELNYPDARNYFSTKLTFVLPLYTGGKLTQYGKISKSMYDMSKLDSQKILNQKVLETKKTFYDISLVENYINNLGQIISNIKKLETIVDSMKVEGYAKDIDILEVQARKAEADSMYNQAKLNKELAYQFLSFLLNKEISSIQKINDMAKMPKVTKEDVNMNLDIQKASLGLKITGMAVDLEKSNFLPTVGAFGEYGSSDDKFLNEFADKDSYTVGVQVQWNIFNGGIDSNNLEKAKVKELQVRDQVELAKKGISLKVKKLQTEINSEAGDIKSFQAQYKFAQKVYQNYQARYREGMVSISDLLIKQSKELEILLKLLTVKNTRNYKIFQLNSILNKGV